MGIFIINKTVEFGKDVNGIYDTHLLNARGYALLPALVPGEKEFINAGQKVNNKLVQIEKSGYDPLIKEMLTGYLFRTTIAQRNIAIIDQNRAVIASNIKEPFIREPLMLYYREMKQTLADPSIAIDNNYKPAATTLDTIIRQNTSKVIYVDLWATWCGPCRAEMPNAEKLKLQYKNKGVVFAAICLDGKKAEWQRLIADMKLSPGQYYSEGTDAKKIGSSLHLQSYPHYLIVNRAGQILSNGDGFKPADPLTAKTIDKLLN
jgi:thiol-disulfide isomerase/thioredoxin